MATFKVLVSGYREVEVEASSADEAWDKYWESPAHEESDLYSTEIQEVVAEGEPWQMHTDFN